VKYASFKESLHFDYLWFNNGFYHGRNRATGQQGSSVAKAAEGFEQSMQAFTAKLDYDQVHIITPANQVAEGHCYKGINAL
jgi:hypothetical protein